MARLGHDQAEGLRRLFVSDLRRMTALVTATAQDARLAAQLAVLLAAQGLRVLLVDEHLAGGHRHAFFAVTPAHDIDDVLHGGVELEQAVVATPQGVHLLAGGGRTRPLTQPSMEARVGLVNTFYRLAGQYDVVLVTTPGGLLQSRPSLAWACQDVVLQCEDRADSVTRVYALIKLLHTAGERRFHLLFAGMEAVVAESVFRRVASVSRRHLHLMPFNLGVLPASERAAGAFLMRLTDQMQTWPLPEQQAGHFPVLMQRLLTGSTARAAAL